MTSAWYFKELLRNETQIFLISKLCFPWLFYTLTPSNSTHYYLISSNLPFTTETTKKFPAEKKTTENLHMKSEHNFEWLHVGPTLLTLLCNILHDGDASSASSWRSNSFSARAPGTAYIGGMASELINQPALETHYLSNRGVLLQCTTKLTHTQLSWRLADGSSAVTEIPGFRSVLANSSLHIAPFADSQLRPGIHNTTYFCVATNPFGSVISSPAKITPLIGSNANRWTLYVSPVTTQLGSSALFTCTIPQHIRPFVDVIEWVHDLDKTGDRYEFTASGHLHIRHVTQHDNMQRFKCRAVHRVTNAERYSSAAKLFITAVAEQPPQSYMTELKMYSTNIKSQSTGREVVQGCFHGSGLPANIQCPYTICNQQSSNRWFG